MFNDSKYTNWYYSIILQAKNQQRTKSSKEYYEKHHIIPKSCGGDNVSENCVLLTPREHYLCHLFLPKMCNDGKAKKKMMYALMMLSNRLKKNNQIKINSRLFEQLRIKHINSISGQNCPWFGRAASEEARKKMSEARKGKKPYDMTAETKQKISQTRKHLELAKGENNPMFNKNHTTKSKQKMSENSKGKTAGSRNGMFGKSRPDLSKRNSETNVRYKIGQYDKDGNLIATHEHSAAAANAIGAKAYRNISFLAKNWKKYPNRTVYGFKWRYLLD